ncbi:porin [Paraburkholderia gardini]|uniref:Outer membrane porin protein 32 n=1 Tax=Paraburkholderia gardini TaxID=2823469 RepID=A0ABN7QU67_9BURK|nr:porin [Paraburkholderia gardini]CAG4918009.1 Outer membrane porin protein 32 [Paraburkholderia gardini]CAG4923291.1 Outer membrane porin protein 32 [Paraburkholderia gardini]
MRLISQGICGAALVLVAGSAAAAESGVMLYGVADTLVQYLDNGGQHSYSERSGGSTGSLFGLKGNEDLGGGLKAQFDVETGFNLNTGGLFADTSSLFYRQAWVGLDHATYGSLSFGRQYEPSFRIVYPTDPFRVNEVASPFSAAVLAVDRNTLSTQYDPGRASNSILYQSPDMRGLKLFGMYAFSSTITQPVQETTGNMLNVGLRYSGYGFYAGLAYVNQHPGQETIASLPAPLSLLGTEHFIGALGYQLGIVNFQFNYSYNRSKDPAPGSLAARLGTAHSLSIAELGATIQVTSADVIEIAGIERNVRGAHDNTPGIEIGAEHSISKRTTFYMRAGYMKNNGSATVSWPGVTVSTTDTKQVLAMIGMTHRF